MALSMQRAGETEKSQGKFRSGESDPARKTEHRTSQQRKRECLTTTARRSVSPYCILTESWKPVVDKADTAVTGDHKS
jgi:hypothetical protein